MLKVIAILMKLETNGDQTSVDLTLTVLVRGHAALKNGVKGIQCVLETNEIRKPS